MTWKGCEHELCYYQDNYGMLTVKTPIKMLLMCWESVCGGSTVLYCTVLYCLESRCRSVSQCVCYQNYSDWHWYDIDTATNNVQLINHRCLSSVLWFSLTPGHNWKYFHLQSKVYFSLLDTSDISGRKRHVF